SPADHGTGSTPNGNVGIPNLSQRPGGRSNPRGYHCGMAGASSRGERPGVITPRLIADDVYAQLMSLIMDGHVEPEQPLSIDALAREFGVSSSPIREALARLESTGLVRRYA